MEIFTLGQQYSIKEKPTVIYCTLILITMHSHQSYPNILITTVVHSYENSTNIDNSTIEPYKNRGLGKQ